LRIVNVLFNELHSIVEMDIWIEGEDKYFISVMFGERTDDTFEVIKFVVEQFKEYGLWEKLSKFKKVCREIFNKMFEVRRYGFKILHFNFANNGEEGLFLDIGVHGEYEIDGWVHDMYDTVVVGYNVENDMLIVESMLGCEKKGNVEECNVTHRFVETLDKIGVLSLLAEANVLLKEILETFKEAKIKVHVD